MNRNARIAGYAAIALAALVITYIQYLRFPAGGIAGFWAQMKVNHITRGITVDLAFFVLAASLFMIGEARRLNIPFVWLYVALGYLVDISVVFPIFLIVRERAMARAGEDTSAFTITDMIVASAITGAIIWQVWFMLQ